ncbi:MAG: hypothetical protein Q7S40_32380 [Opitutaceae bacterium]|nr:hypothetical protein [Opitutaceae bacterium]
MSITATVENNTIKLSAGVHLPDGTAVRVEPIEAEPRGTFGKRYAEFVGAVKDTPGDLAENHDHYLYGAPKRTA